MNNKQISGNFAIEVEGDFDESKTVGEGENAVSVKEARDQSAIAYISQRDGLSAVYKKLLKAGEKRNTLGYSDEAAASFGSALEAALAPYGAFAVSVTEHVPGETAASRSQATAMWTQIKAEPAKFNAAMLGLESFNGVSDDDGIEACHAFLTGFRKPSVRKATAE